MPKYFANISPLETAVKTKSFHGVGRCRNERCVASNSCPRVSIATLQATRLEAGVDVTAVGPRTPVVDDNLVELEVEIVAGTALPEAQIAEGKVVVLVPGCQVVDTDEDARLVCYGEESIR
jgi:hypothetical protein